jgi:hypothetical protein
MDWRGATHVGFRSSLGLVIVVSALGMGVPAPNAQAVVTTETIKLVAPEGAAGDSCGSSRAADGDLIVVGARYDDTDAGADAGSVTVFRLDRDAGEFVVAAKLTDPDGAAADSFGAAVAVDGDVILVGAYLDDTESGVDAGSVTVFRPDGEGGYLSTKLTDPDGAVSDRFGYSVAVGGGRLVVGAYLDDTGALSNSGSITVFEPDESGAWRPRKLAGRGFGSQFGQSVAVDGHRIVVGAPGRPSAFLLETDDTGGWSATELPCPTTFCEAYATAVAISGRRIAIGERTTNYLDGWVYVFELDETGEWIPTYLDDVVTGLGGSVAIAPHQILSGASPERFSAGAVSVWQADGEGGWTTITLIDPDGAVGDLFGVSVAALGHRIVAGSSGDDTDAGDDAGSITVLTLAEQ